MIFKGEIKKIDPQTAIQALLFILMDLCYSQPQSEEVCLPDKMVNAETPSKSMC